MYVSLHSLLERHGIKHRVIFIFLLFVAFKRLLRSLSVAELQDSCCVYQIKLQRVFQ